MPNDFRVIMRAENPSEPMSVFFNIHGGLPNETPEAMSDRIIYFVVRAILAFNRKLSAFVSHIKMKSLVKNVGRKASCHWTVEIKYGANETNCTKRLNLPFRISLSASANRIGIGKPARSK